MSALVAHFLNVGHGDCTFLEFPSGRLAMIDINNTESLPEADVDALAQARGMSTAAFKSAAAGTRSWEDYYKSLLDDPVDYYRANFEGRSIFRYIQTHPDMDHMTGLYRFFFQEEIPLQCFWDVAHAKDLSHAEFDNSRYDWSDWLAYRCMRNGVHPNDIDAEWNMRVINNHRGARGQFWTDDDMTVLSPTPELIDDCNVRESWNDSSYVLRLNYGGRRLILPGDAEAPAWRSILDGHNREQLNCNVLKASHHGRESGYHFDAVDAMNPSFVVCSVGKKPSTDASDEYAAHGASVLSTRFHGTVKVTMWWDGEIWIDTAKGGRLHTLAPLAAA